MMQGRAAEQPFAALAPVVSDAQEADMAYLLRAQLQGH